MLAIIVRIVYFCNFYWKFRLLIPDKDQNYFKNYTTNSFVVKTSFGRLSGTTLELCLLNKDLDV